MSINPWELIKAGAMSLSSSLFGSKEESDEKSNYRRINDQSILMANIEQVIKKEKYYSIENGPLSIGYDIDNPESSVNKLYNFKSFIESYNKLSPADLSNLVPFIEIYKVYPEEENIPDYKFAFNNYYPLKAQQSILSNGSDRGYQANLVSAEFVSQGKDTATMFLYSIKLNFIFDSVATIFHENSRYIELFNPPKKHVDKVRNADYKYYQLKLKFGWNVNTDFPENISTALHPVELNKFAEASRSSVYMNYIKHNLIINEDGTVSLSVEYIGSIDAESRDANNINAFDSDSVSALKIIQEEIETKERLIREERSGIQINPEKDEDDKVTMKFTKDGKEINDIPSTDVSYLKERYEKKFKLEKNSLDELLETIIKNISRQYNNHFSYIQINKEQYDQASAISEQYSAYNETEKIEKIQELNRLYSDKKTTRLVTAEELENPSYSRAPHKDVAVSEYLKANYLYGDSLGLSDDNRTVSVYTIRYFTFGTLIAALRTMSPEYLVIATNCNISFAGDAISGKKFNETQSNYKLTIDSGIKVDDSYVVLQNRILPVNIFDIPISLSTFKYWFLKNVTSQNLTSMTLINFLNLCVNDLLLLAVRPDNKDYIPKQNIRFKYFFDKVDINTENPLLKAANTLSTYTKSDADLKLAQNLLSDNGTIPAEKRKYHSSGIAVQNKDLTIIDDNPAVTKITKKIIIFYCIPTFVTRKVSLKKDIEEGIPHFFYGAANSLANKITFRDENIPFYKEANIQTQVDRKPWSPGVFLRGKYNVIIDTIGTVNFRVGSMFYVSPTFTGVIDPSEPIKYGIGGYFNLVSTKISIESGKYITSLEGNWVSTGTGEYSDLTHKGYEIRKDILPKNYDVNKSVSEILSDAKQLNEQEKRQVDDAFGRTTTRERGLKL